MRIRISVFSDTLDAMGTKKRVAPPAALVRAEHHAAPVHLTKPQREILEDALREGEDLREEMQAAVLRYGRFLLEKVFANDATAALDDKSKNPIWQELLDRAGGPTLGLNRHMLYVAVRIAANDRRITERAWRGLDAARKELLLPLKTPPLLLEAAKRVSDMDMSQAKTKEYVTELLKQNGKTRQVRLTARGLRSRIRAATGAFDGGTVKRLKSLRSQISSEERDALARDVETLRDLLSTVLRELR